MSSYYVYILANKSKTLYIGVTNDLIRRLYEHKNKLIEGFTRKYNISRLVHYEEFKNIDDAIKREKQLKNWHRQWKINLIETANKNWEDLSKEIKI
jgi:putative endonuclease